MSLDQCLKTRTGLLHSHILREFTNFIYLKNNTGQGEKNEWRENIKNLNQQCYKNLFIFSLIKKKKKGNSVNL